MANEGAEAYKSELYGKEIQIVRKIGAKQSGYKILSEKRQVISTRKDTINEILQALSISPENPLCILHQEVAKTFLLNNDGKKKYQVFWFVFIFIKFRSSVSFIEVLHESFSIRSNETSVWRRSLYCSIDSKTNRNNAWSKNEFFFDRRNKFVFGFQKHVQMLRSIEPFERQVKKIEIRRDQETRKHALEIELTQSRAAEAQQVNRFDFETIWKCSNWFSKEIFNVQHELDQTQKSKDMIETNMVATLVNEMKRNEDLLFSFVFFLFFFF